MIPRGIASDTLPSTSEPLKETPRGAGPLTGKLSNPITLFVVGLSLFFVAVALFSAAYLESDGRGGVLPGPAGDEFATAASVFGWISLLASLAFFGLLVYIKVIEREEAEESVLKDEPRDYDFNPVGPQKEEVIKVRCRYCSTLNDVNAKNCVACGATL